jgi:hypothetical protein
MRNHGSPPMAKPRIASVEMRPDCPPSIDECPASCFHAAYFGSENATYTPPCGAFGSRALLVPITTYCFPSIM